MKMLNIINTTKKAYIFNDKDNEKFIIIILIIIIIIIIIDNNYYDKYYEIEKKEYLNYNIIFLFKSIK